MSGGGVSPVLATSPEALRRAARTLRRLGEDLEGLSARVAMSGGFDHGWSGLAALEQQARAGALSRLVSLSAAPGLDVAHALEGCADVAEDAGARVRAGVRRLEQGLAELARLRALGPPLEPLLEEAWHRRVREVEQEVASARTLMEQAEDSFDTAQQQAAGVLVRAWAVVEEAPNLWQVGRAVHGAVTALPKKVLRIVRTTDMVLSLARARWAADAGVRAAALQRGSARLGQLWQQLTSPKTRTFLGRARFLPGPTGTVMSWLSAWGDRRDGGGYAGWRGGVTQVLATGALIGGPVTLAGFIPGMQVAAPVGVGLITVYQSWMLGNAAWDALPTARRYARLAIRHAPRVRDAALDLARRARDRAVGRLTDLRTAALGRVATVGLQATRRMQDVRAGVEDLLGRVPDTEPLRDRIRQVGVPIRLPGVPLGPVLRAPVDLGRLPGMGGAG